jgi:hypothetical protein
MNFPAHMTVEFNDEDRAALKSAQQAFNDGMAPLNERQRLDRATVISGGLRKSDPLTRALAEQYVSAANLKAKITAAQSEVKELERELNKGGVIVRNRGEAHERLATLKRDVDLDQARLIALHHDTLETPRRKAAIHFREQRAEAAKNAALSEAVARKEQELAAEALDRQAEQIAKARLSKAGRGFNRAGNSQ